MIISSDLKILSDYKTNNNKSQENNMPHSNKLHDSLDTFARQHKELALKFQEFARFVKDCTQTPAVANHSITVSLQHLDSGFFTTSFASRTVTFVFKSFLDDSETLQGNVKTYLQQAFPEPKQFQFGEFVFDEMGHTDIKLQDEDAPVNFANDLVTLDIVLHFIRESLFK